MAGVMSTNRFFGRCSLVTSGRWLKCFQRSQTKSFTAPLAMEKLNVFRILIKISRCHLEPSGSQHLFYLPTSSLTTCKAVSNYSKLIQTSGGKKIPHSTAWGLIEINRKKTLSTASCTWKATRSFHERHKMGNWMETMYKSFETKDEKAHFVMKIFNIMNEMTSNKSFWKFSWMNFFLMAQVELDCKAIMQNVPLKGFSYLWTSRKEKLFWIIFGTQFSNENFT